MTLEHDISHALKPIQQVLVDVTRRRLTVYLRVEEGVTAESDCIVLDPDEAELGADDFTPVQAEQLSMGEFLSIQDLRSVRENLLATKPDATEEDLYDAVRYYFENDAFLST